MYKNIYVIAEADSRILNLYANPTRRYINRDKVVTGMGLGISTIDNLVNEIKLNLSFKKK